MQQQKENTMTTKNKNYVWYFAAVVGSFATMNFNGYIIPFFYPLAMITLIMIHEELKQ